MGKNEKDSLITKTFKIIKPKNNSKFNNPMPARTAASIAYLLRLKKPVKITHKPNIIENNET